MRACCFVIALLFPVVSLAEETAARKAYVKAMNLGRPGPARDEAVWLLAINEVGEFVRALPELKPYAKLQLVAVVAQKIKDLDRGESDYPRTEWIDALIEHAEKAPDHAKNSYFVFMAGIADSKVVALGLKYRAQGVNDLVRRSAARMADLSRDAFVQANSE